jgi:endonuclease YncB( thermonuclease family)
MRFLFALFLALALCYSARSQATDPPDITAKVIEVIDGDTFAIKDPETGHRRRVSLPALDAPELPQKYGKEAKANLEKLLKGQSVTISYVTRGNRPVIAKIAVNGQDAGLAQLKAGFAWFMRGKPFKDGDNDRRQYGPAESEAKRAKLGLWQDPEPITPAEYRKQAKIAAFGPAPPLETQVVGNKTTKKFHMPHCPGYKGVAEKNRVLFATAEAAAKDGYTLAGNCRGTPKPKPVVAAASAPDVSAPTAKSNEPAQFVGNKNTKVYHKRGCPGYSRVIPANAVNFSSSEAAEKAGYRRAKNCP